MRIVVQRVSDDLWQAVAERSGRDNDNEQHNVRVRGREVLNEAGSIH